MRPSGKLLPTVAVLPDYARSFDCVNAARCAASTAPRMTTVWLAETLRA
jgi:hypothetical protein